MAARPALLQIEDADVIFNGFSIVGCFLPGSKFRLLSNVPLSSLLGLPIAYLLGFFQIFGLLQILLR